MNNQTILIAGAGVSGLVCAILLARAGYSVTVIEKSIRTAPAIRGFKRNGLYFDTGVHEIGAVGKGEILDRYLTHLNCRQEYDLFDETAYEKIRFTHDSSEYSIPNAPDVLAETLICEFPQDADGIRRVIKTMSEIYDRMPMVNANANIDAFGFNTFNDMPLAEYLMQEIKEEKLRTIFASKCLLSGVSPAKSSFISHSLLSASYFFKTGNFKNGGAAFADSLESEALRSGAKLITGSGLKTVTRMENGRYSCISGNGECYEADNVIFSTHRAKMCEILDEGIMGEKYRSYLLRLEDTMSAEIFFASADIAKRHVSPSVEYIFHSPEMSHITTEDTIYAARSGANGMKEKSAVTLITPACFDKFSAWEGTFIARRGKGYLDFKKSNYDKLINRLAKYCSEYSSLVYVDSATPLTIRDYLNNAGGSIYGIAHLADQILPVPRLKTKGIFLTGQGIVAQGIFGAILSAYLTSSFFVGLDKLMNDLKNTVVS